MAKKIFVLTDNKIWLEKIKDWKPNHVTSVRLFCSPKGASLFKDEIESGSISVIDVVKDEKWIIENFDIGISCHCKQIFSKNLVESLPCFNFHPGFNPYNRGWFPQVFSILNKKPVGATLHKMDAEIDHGAIIAQTYVEIYEWDTSGTVYDRILDAEFNLFESQIESIINASFKSVPAKGEGNYNSFLDFKELCRIDLDKKLTFGEAIDYLRALTFEGYENAYFISRNGRKVFISLEIRADE